MTASGRLAKYRSRALTAAVGHDDAEGARLAIRRRFECRVLFEGHCGDGHGEDDHCRDGDDREARHPAATSTPIHLEERVGRLRQSLCGGVKVLAKAALDAHAPALRPPEEVRRAGASDFFDGTSARSPDTTCCVDSAVPHRRTPTVPRWLRPSRDGTRRTVTTHLASQYRRGPTKGNGAVMAFRDPTTITIPPPPPRMHARPHTRSSAPGRSMKRARVRPTAESAEGSTDIATAAGPPHSSARRRAQQRGDGQQAAGRAPHAVAPTRGRGTDATRVERPTRERSHLRPSCTTPRHDARATRPRDRGLPADGAVRVCRS